MARSDPRRPLAERFWEKVDKNGPIQPHMKTQCWIWTASVMKSGYGRIGIGGSKTITAHRAAWLLIHGPIPEGKWVLHDCDEKRCVRHLHLGDRRTNTQEARERKRFSHGPSHGEATSAGAPRGTHHKGSILKEEDIPRIRALHRSGRSSTSIGVEFGVSAATISQVVRSKTWRHV